MLVSGQTYAFLTDWLSSRLLNDAGAAITVECLSRNSAKVNKGVIAHLNTAIEKYVLRSNECYFMVGDSGDLYAYNGRYYEPIDKAILSELMKRVLEEIGASPIYVTYAPKTIAEECYSRLRSSDELLFEPNRRYIVFDNGVFDLETGKLNAFKSAYKTDLVMPYPYLRRADVDKIYKPGSEEWENYHLWERKLAEIIPIREASDCFQELCGAIFSNRKKYRHEYFGILIGSGGNGKSVLVNAIANMIGKEFVSRYTLQQLFKSSRSDRFIADLKGKLINFCDDMNMVDFSGGDFKRFVSGDEIQCMKAYATEPIKVSAPPLIGCTNSMPEFKDDTYAHFRRILQIQTTILQFGESPNTPRDPRLTDKLSEIPSKQAIFSWVYEGYVRFVRNGGNITIPDTIKELVKEMQLSASPQRRWLRDRGYLPANEIDKEKAELISFQDLHKDYATYCRTEEGIPENKILDKRKLGCFLKEDGYKSKRKMSRYKSLTYYIMQKGIINESEK